MNDSTHAGIAPDKVKVAIRVRPFNRREIDLKTKCVVEVKGDQTILHYVHVPTPVNVSAPTPAATSTPSGKNTPVPSSNKETTNQNPVSTSTFRPPKTFTFDNCFWSFNESDPHYASQEYVFEQLGQSVLDSAFQGYNACIFAYGQTGSGKSYTMMGSPHEKGLIPRLCDAIFERISARIREDPSSTFKLEVSYMEIYNEKVHDLLDPAGARHNLKVREHNILGPYVDGLSTLAVSSFEEINSLMAEGNKSRTVAATNMNSESSRSHAVFTLTLTCSQYDSLADVRGERVSKMSLVDLAGSERAVKTGAVGERLKEGSNINKSLTTLGLVISKLADQASGKNKREQFVPYRDSVLTWLLKDNLGGNSKTIMISTISPAADSYEETLSTLRYADRAKRIVNHAIINEDPNNRIIRELREEVEQLKEQLMHATVQTELKERLVESEKLIKEMEQTWEEKLRKTEKIHQERQQALETMGISVQSSGIAVEKDRYYLVNLNADPSMNALLVYYLKEHTLIGSGAEQDIKLSGVGIMPEHALIEIDRQNNEIWMEAIDGARTYVNGRPVIERVMLRNGDRILWGTNHFFSLNCPASTNAMSRSMHAEENNYFDYNYARDELLSCNNPDLEATMYALERQFEPQQWPLQIGKLTGNMLASPHGDFALSGSSTFLPGSSSKFGGSTAGRLGGSTLNLSSPSAMANYVRMEKLAQEREENFRQSLSRLREEIARANTLAHEANLISEEMRRNTEFKVTLQIPAANLSPNRLRRGMFVSEPAILVRRRNAPQQVWSMEKFDAKLIEMREFYQDWKERQEQKKLKHQNSVDSDISTTSHSPGSSPRIERRNDPFYELQENHLLIGVANIFLEVLMHDVMLDYQVPIISQQGEVVGRLSVEFGRIEGQFGERIADAASDIETSSSDDGSHDGSQETSNLTTITTPNQPLGKNQVRVRLNIRYARGLPTELSNFVFCQYSVWGYPDLIVVPATSVEAGSDYLENHTSTPKLALNIPTNTSPDEKIFQFNYRRDFAITLNEDFLEHCTDGALSIEVWGHRISAFSPRNPLKTDWGIQEEQIKISRSLADRWRELKRNLELWVEIQELNEQGEYTPVDVQPAPDIWTGGIYQLRQGQQRRISVLVSPVQDSGALPVICDSICWVSIGCVSLRLKSQKSLDSYQEGDLNTLREKWSDILAKRKAYLDEQLMEKTNKTKEEIEREQSLMAQLVKVIEEINASKCPVPGSGIPGSEAGNFEPAAGMESHIPVIFLDLNTDTLSSSRVAEIPGTNSILPKEHNGSPFFSLKLMNTNSNGDVSALAMWDSSIHESQYLNRITGPNERIFLILKVCVRLSHPVPIDVVLRKRIAINVYKKQSITKNIFKRISRADLPLLSTGVTYEMVASIPKESEDIEDRESLALLAASAVDLTACDGESYIERYSKSVSAVESILDLDRLRQEVAVRELLTKKAKYAVRPVQSSGITASGSLLSVGSEALLRKTVSVPNMANIAGQFRAAPGGGPPLLTTVDGQRSATSAVNTPTNGNRADSSFDLSYLTGAADRIRQKATNIFGSMTGLNQLDQSDEIKSSTPNHKSVTQIAVDARPSGVATSSPISSLMNPLLATTTKQLKPMCTLLEEQNSREEESDTVANDSLESSNGKPVEQISVQVTPPQDKKSLSNNEVEDSCYIVYDSQASPTPPNRHDGDDEDDEEVARLVKSSAELRVSTPTLSISSSSGYDGASSLSQATAMDVPISGTPVSGESVPFSSNPSSLSMPSSTTGSGDEFESEDTANHVDNNLMTKSDHSEDSFSSKSNNNKAPQEHLPDWMVVGESVRISPDSKLGVIAFVGETEFAPGSVWVGVVLDTPTGKNDGTVNGVSYFSCKPKYGIFVRPDKLKCDPKGRALRRNAPAPAKMNGKVK